MPIITKPLTIIKGDQNIVELNKNDLASISKVLNDTYFNNELNWKEVIITYRNTDSNQINKLFFNPQEENPQGKFDISSRARDGSWEIQNITIRDFDNGNIVILRDELTTAEFDILVNAVLVALGLLDEPFCIAASDNSKINGFPNSVKVQNDGKILVAGLISSYDEDFDRKFIRLNSNGTLDVPFTFAINDGDKFGSGSIFSIATHNNNRILVGGQIFGYDGNLARSNFLGFNSNGTLDETFTNEASGDENSSWPKFNGPVRSVVVQANDQILVGGNFTHYDDQFETNERSRLVRLNSNGTLDEAFCIAASDGSKFNNEITAIAVQPNGQILIAGNFTSYDDGGLLGRNRLIRLNANGTLDEAFCVEASDGNKFNNTIDTIAVQANGKILIGGIFTDYAETVGRNRLIRLNSDGTLDEAFCIAAVDNDKFSDPEFLPNEGRIVSIKIQDNDQILIGGLFENYAGTVGRNQLVRLNSNGTLDEDFCIAAVDGKFNSNVFAIEIQTDSKILVGGGFQDYAGTVGRNHLIRLQ